MKGLGFIRAAIGALLSSFAGRAAAPNQADRFRALSYTANTGAGVVRSVRRSRRTVAMDKREATKARNVARHLQRVKRKGRGS